MKRIIGFLVLLAIAGVIFTVCGEDPPDKPDSSNTASSSSSNTGSEVCGDVLDAVTWTSTGNITGYCGTPVEITWNSVPCATSYEIRISTDSNFGTSQVTDEVTSPSFTTDPAVTGHPASSGNYYVFVKPKRTGMAAYESTTKTIVLITIPTATANAPSNNTAVTTSTMNFSWTADSAAPDDTSYALQIFKEGSSQNLVPSLTVTYDSNGLGATVTGLGDGDFSWKIKSYNSNCESISTAAFFTHATFNATVTPLNESFSGGDCGDPYWSPCGTSGSPYTTSDTIFNLAWEEVTGAVEYEVDEAGLTSPVDAPNRCLNVGYPSASNVTKTWRVRAWDGDPDIPGSKVTEWSTTCYYHIN
jgi:hypothetical protein